MLHTPYVDDVAVTARDSRPDDRTPIALVHHANQYVIADRYADREGVAEIVGVDSAAHEGTYRRGILPLLTMHLHYRVPFALHISGTLIESLAWHRPETFRLIKRLHREGLLEMVGSACCQPVIPLISREHARWQLNEELRLFALHLDCDPRSVKTFWVPERVWDTALLAPVLTDPRLLNGGYRNVLIDDRLLHATGGVYHGSARERFDRDGAMSADSCTPYAIAGGEGLVAIPISRQLRYLIPPTADHAMDGLDTALRTLPRNNGAVAVYGDDLERASGVGGWDPRHPDAYERFLEWLTRQSWLRVVMVGRCADGHAETRAIDRGTFYELAQIWTAGEDYRGWAEDPHCAEHRAYLSAAEAALRAAAARGADPGLLELGWCHLGHCSYETAWHDPHADDSARRLAGWVAALTSHARACLVVAAAAEWFTQRDGRAHVDLVDIDEDGDKELVIKNDALMAVVSPRWGGRLTYLFDLTGRSGRLAVGNISDDWNLQEELHRYMDLPANHPGALVDAGHEHDRYDAEVQESGGDGRVTVALRNTDRGSALEGLVKIVSLGPADAHLNIQYHVPRQVWRVGVECCLSPDYRRLLREGRRAIQPFDGPSWRGWRCGSAHAWVSLSRQDSTVWDTPRQRECGHGMMVRVTSFSRSFALAIGVGVPPQMRAAFAAASGAAAWSNFPSIPASDTHFMRRLFGRTFTATGYCVPPLRACRVRVLKQHHDRATFEYRLSFGTSRCSFSPTESLVGIWRRDGRGGELHRLLVELSRAGFDGNRGVAVPRPVAYCQAAQLQLTHRAPGRTLKQWLTMPGLDWTGTATGVARWMAALHSCRVMPPVDRPQPNEDEVLERWRMELADAQPIWLLNSRAQFDRLVDLMRAWRGAAPAAAPALVHGDFHPENILVRGALVSVVDFEHYHLGDAAQDVGSFIGHLHIQSDRHQGAYGRPADLSHVQRHLVATYRRFRPDTALDGVAFYLAYTIVKHLVHTVRMRGTDTSENVDRWLALAIRGLETVSEMGASAFGC